MKGPRCLQLGMPSWRDLRLLATTGLWVTLMPALLCLLRLSDLLRLLRWPRQTCVPPLRDVQRATRYVDALLRCHPLSRKNCLVRCLVLYRILGSMGMPVSIHFGVRRAGGTWAGHAWLTQSQWPGLSLGGESDRFTAVYAFPEPARVQRAEA